MVLKSGCNGYDSMMFILESTGCGGGGEAFTSRTRGICVLDGWVMCRHQGLASSQGLGHWATTAHSLGVACCLFSTVACGWCHLGVPARPGPVTCRICEVGAWLRVTYQPNKQCRLAKGAPGLHQEQAGASGRGGSPHSTSRPDVQSMVIFWGHGMWQVVLEGGRKEDDTMAAVSASDFKSHGSSCCGYPQGTAVVSNMAAVHGPCSASGRTAHFVIAVWVLFFPGWVRQPGVSKNRGRLGLVQ